MEQDKLNQIVELETKFLKLTENGHPNVVDNGFFIDAVFNVTAKLKKQCLSNENYLVQHDEHVKIVDELYRSLKAFECLYTQCLGEK